MDIKIASIKKLKYILKDIDCSSTGAVLCSSYPIQKEWFQKLYSFISFEFDDVLKSSGSAFNNNIANDIKNYVENVSRKIETLYICCDSGESRSSALAAATIKYMNGNDDEIWNNPLYHPNPLVYKIQCNAYGINVSEFKVRRLVRANNLALKKAIKKSAIKNKKKG